MTTSRRIQREDPAYLQAMREAKELFDAAIAKNSMKGRGRPAKTAVAAPAEVTIEDEIDVSDVIAEAMVETGEHESPFVETVAPVKKSAVKVPAKVAAKPTKPTKSTKSTTAAKPAAKPSAKPAARPAAKKTVARKAPAAKKKR